MKLIPRIKNKKITLRPDVTNYVIVWKYDDGTMHPISGTFQSQENALERYEKAKEALKKLKESSMSSYYKNLEDVLLIELNVEMNIIK